MALAIMQKYKLATDDVLFYNFECKPVYLKALPPAATVFHVHYTERPWMKRSIYKKLVPADLRKAIVFLLLYKRFSHRLPPRQSEYIFYHHGMGNDLVGFLLTAPQCTHGALVEEGSACYSKQIYAAFENFLKLASDIGNKPLKRFPKFLAHYLRFAFHKKIYKCYAKYFPAKLPQAKAYVLNKEAFATARIQREVIPFYHDKTFVAKIAKLPTKATIFFMDSTIDKADWIADKPAYYAGLQAAFQQLPNDTPCYIKFHQNNTANTQQKIITILHNIGITTRRLASDIPPEQIFLQKKHLTIYGLRSSALLYAGILKAGRIFSLDEYVAATYHHPKTDLRIDFTNLKTIYQKNGVQFLQPTPAQLKHRTRSSRTLAMS